MENMEENFDQEINETFKKIDAETAMNDVDRFIAKLKINPLKLETLEKDKGVLIDLLMDGHLIIDSEERAIYKPYDSFEYDGQPVKQVRFVGRRITVNEFEKNMKGKNDEAKARTMFSYLIGKPSAFLTRMSMDDYGLMASISAFFLPR